MSVCSLHSETSVRILPAPDICTLHPHSHHQLGVILDQCGRHPCQDLYRSDHSAHDDHPAVWI